MSEEFGVRTVDAGHDVIVVVAGDVDIESQARLRRAIDRARARGRRLVVDLAHTRFVDRTAVEELLRAHLAQACSGTTLVLRSPSDRLMRMVRVLGLHTVFHVEPRRRPAGTPPVRRPPPADAPLAASPPAGATRQPDATGRGEAQAGRHATRGNPGGETAPWHVAEGAAGGEAARLPGVASGPGAAQAERRAGHRKAGGEAARPPRVASGGGSGEAGHGGAAGDGRPGGRGHGSGERAHGEDGAERPPALPRRVPGLAWRRRGPDGAPDPGPGPGPGPEAAGERAGGGDPPPLTSLPAGQAVVTPEAAALMGRFAQACEALADAADAAARLQARLAEPWWPIEVREVEVARYLARANEARSRARLVAAQLAASTVTP